MTEQADLHPGELQPSDLELLLRQSMSYGKDMARIFSLEKERREQLELANQLLQETFSSVPAGLVILDHLFCIVGANTAFCKLLGKETTEQELLGTTIGAALGLSAYELITMLTTMQNSGVDADEAQITLGDTRSHVRAAVLHAGQSRGWVLTFYALDMLAAPVPPPAAEVVPVEAPAASNVVNQEQLDQMRQELDNTTRQALVYARDMRAMFQKLQQANAELKKLNAQLQQLNDLKSSFLSVIGHELRSPFVDLNLALQTFSRYGTENLVPEQRDLLSSIETSSKRAFQRVDKLVKYVNLLSKRGTLQMGEFEVAPLVADVAAALEPMALRKRQQLTVNAERHTAHNADRELISESLWHLLHNAIRFTPNGGHIEIDVHSKPEYLVFEVKDDGPGIPETKQAGLWEPFEQMADAVLRSEEGLGLGLPLVRYAATAHGGEAFMHSKENVGSVVGFWIPLNGSSVTVEST